MKLSVTESLCPECLRRVPASRVKQDDDVYLVKACPEHGGFRSIIWRGPPDYASWVGTKPPNPPGVTQTVSERGCPRDCGLCPEHQQQTCCVLLEVTSRCDLGCPVCFASSGTGSERDPALDEIQEWFRLLREAAGRCNIQLSGGEPTVRDDLPEILAMGRRLGFSFFQLNTNGLRLASETGYAERLADAGLSTVFLQFDGLGDDIYRRIRGKQLFDQKEAAIAECAAAGLGVVLVPTLMPGVNTGQVGAIIDHALRWAPHVRGVHFQPISYFGRYPKPPEDHDRYTLPELMRDLETQTEGRFPASALRSSGCGHSLCSFSGDFLLMGDGSVRSLADQAGSRRCCAGGGETEPIERQRSFIARRWSARGGLTATSGAAAAAERPGQTADCAAVIAGGSRDPVMSLDDFLERMRSHVFTVTAMTFQDVWTVDLERLRHCHLHVVAPGGRIVPFCAYNLTDTAGNSLHRRTAARAPVEGSRAPAPARSCAPASGETS